MIERTASCSCGQLTARCEGEPIRVVVCHCLACKQRSGSAFSWNARWPEGKVTVSGTAKDYVRVGDEGTPITYSFCPNCGVTVFYRTQGMQGTAIPIGAFGTTGAPQPSITVYVNRQEPWVDITADPLEVWS